MSKLQDLYRGSEETEIIAMLETIRDANWHGRIVTEIPGDGIASLLSTRGLVTPARLIGAHRDIVETVRQVMSI